jgi:hypothetical protein
MRTSESAVGVDNQLLLVGLAEEVEHGVGEAVAVDRPATQRSDLPTA